MNILILAAGVEQSSDPEGYPLCLTEFSGVPLVQRLVDACARLEPSHFVFLFREQDVREYHLDNVVGLLTARAVVLPVHGQTQGAACTALLASGYADNDDELLILNGNEFVDVNFLKILEDFRARELDAGVAVFRSVHPRYSYVKIGADGLVVEASEKRPISNSATAGFYWFRRGCEFVGAAKNLVRKNAHINGRFYICPTFNELILLGRRIGTHPIDGRLYHPLKDERQVRQFEQVAGKDTE